MKGTKNATKGVLKFTDLLTGFYTDKMMDKSVCPKKVLKNQNFTILLVCFHIQSYLRIKETKTLWWKGLKKAPRGLKILQKFKLCLSGFSLVLLTDSLTDLHTEKVMDRSVSPQKGLKKWKFMSQKHKHVFISKVMST